MQTASLPATLIALIANHSDLSKYDLSSLTQIMYGGSPTPLLRTGVFVGMTLDLETTNYYVRWNVLPAARVWAQEAGGAVEGQTSRLVGGQRQRGHHADDLGLADERMVGELVFLALFVG